MSGIKEEDMHQTISLVLVGLSLLASREASAVTADLVATIDAKKTCGIDTCVQAAIAPVSFQFRLSIPDELITRYFYTQPASPFFTRGDAGWSAWSDDPDAFVDPTNMPFWSELQAVQTRSVSQLMDESDTSRRKTFAANSFDSFDVLSTRTVDIPTAR